MCEVLHGQQGHVFVCGDVRMARDVAQALRALLARALRLSQQQAEEYFQQLKVAQSQPSPCIHRRQARLLCLGDRAQREPLGALGLPAQLLLTGGHRGALLLCTYRGSWGSALQGAGSIRSCRLYCTIRSCCFLRTSCYQNSSWCSCAWDSGSSLSLALTKVCNHRTSATNAKGLLVTELMDKE